MKPKLSFIALLLFVFVFSACEKEVPPPHSDMNGNSPSMSADYSPNPDQRLTTDRSLQILALGFTDLVADSQFVDALYRTMPCDGWLGLEEFGRYFNAATVDRNLYAEMNLAIRKYLKDNTNRDYVTPAIQQLKIDGVQYVPDITIPYFGETNLLIPPIVAAGVDDENDRLTGYLVAGRDIAFYASSTSPLQMLTIESDLVGTTYQAPMFEGVSSVFSTLRAQSISSEEARNRPMIVIAVGDGPDPNRENDPCYQSNGGGGWTGGTGSGGTSGSGIGCTVGADEDCAYKTGPVNYPMCIGGCDPIFTNTNQCLSTVSFESGQLFAPHNSGSNTSKVRYMISKMKNNGLNELMGVVDNPAPNVIVSNLGLNKCRIKLEDRNSTNTSLNAVVNYTQHTLLQEICQWSPTWGGNSFVLATGFDINANGEAFGNATSTFWIYNRYWITIYEDDWWVTNPKEIPAPGITYLTNEEYHQIRATASTDLYYNGFLNLDLVGCTANFCDQISLNDAYPGNFVLRVHD
ncbi:MAG: hypothetical protein IPP17_00900 [Bacteroidetes bacterium]|nr:hypothetical protein [Bacteroidota bacterium]